MPHPELLEVEEAADVEAAGALAGELPPHQLRLAVAPLAEEKSLPPNVLLLCKPVPAEFFLKREKKP